MNSQDAIDLGREAIIECLMIGSPILLAGLVIGLIVGMLQAMTQVHDQTVAFFPKLLGLCLLIALALPWLSGRMKDYTEQLLEKPVTSLEATLPAIDEPESAPVEFEPVMPGTDEVANSYVPGSSMPVVEQHAGTHSSMPVMVPSTTSMPVAGQGRVSGIRTAGSATPADGEITR
ncbi:MAG: flagellar biosynthetic protein FliQ [Planctomycetota bacterium]